MGKPKSVQAAKVGENYSWGDFGSADASGVNFSPIVSSNLATTQSGIGQYLNELINPSYQNESFRARQELIDQANQQYANQLGAEAIARGARGSATQSILNSIAANRSNQLRQAMTQEDQRVSNILSQLAGMEGNYFNMGNTMAQNILQRALANQSAQNAANIANAQAQNQWRNNLIGGVASLGGAALGAATGGLGTLALGGLGSALAGQAKIPGAAIDPMQAMSAANMF